MLTVTLRGEAIHTLDALAERPGGAWYDVWSEIVGIRYGRIGLSVAPGEIGLHSRKVDGGSAKAVFGVNRSYPDVIIIERIDIFPARRSIWKWK